MKHENNIEKTSPKVSVIIPFYSSKKWLIEAIASAINQTYFNFEIIVVNDGSKEDITEIKKTYSKEVTIINQENVGAGQSRNNAIKICNGEYIAFLDADDIWLPEKLEKQICFMVENKLLWSHTDYMRFYDESSKKVHMKCPLSGDVFPKILFWNPIATPCVIVKREVFIENTNLGFSNNRVGEDGYLWQKIGEHYSLGYLPIVLSKVRMHGNNSSIRASSQLEARGQLINSLKTYKYRFQSQILYQYLLILTKYCNYAYWSISNVSINIKLKPKITELVYKLIYLPIYINIRIIRRFL